MKQEQYPLYFGDVKIARTAKRKRLKEDIFIGNYYNVPFIVFGRNLPSKFQIDSFCYAQTSPLAVSHTASGCPADFRLCVLNNFSYPFGMLELLCFKYKWKKRCSASLFSVEYYSVVTVTFNLIQIFKAVCYAVRSYVERQIFHIFHGVFYVCAVL